MAQSSWPFENVDTSETQFSQWARNIGEGVKTGALNELEVFADSTGMQVKVRSGQALVRGHYYQNTAELALSLSAADLTNPRIDTVVVELDPSANSIELKAIEGTPDPSPTAEPVVQTDAGIYQIKLANVAVAANATTITAGNVTDTRFYIEDFSGTVPGSAITGEITTATMDGDRLFGAIDSATIPSSNVTGLTLSDVSDVTATATEVNYTDGVTSNIQSQLDGKQSDVITTRGDLVVGNSSGEATRLGRGSNGQYLSSNGTDLVWSDVSAGGMTLLLSAGLQSTATYEANNIPQTYKKLVIVLDKVHRAGFNNGLMYLRFRIGTSDQNVRYMRVKTGQNPDSIDNNYVELGELGTDVTESAAYTITLDNYNTFNNQKPFLVYGLARLNNNSTTVLASGMVDVSSRIDSIEIETPGGGDFEFGSSIKIYGVS